MNHHILVIHPILPRLPIGFISLRLSLSSGETRKKLSYAPLALCFRRARASSRESTHSINYVSRDGINIVIAPRLEFSIQLAASLRLQSDRHKFSTRQNRNDRDETLSIPFSFIGRNFIEQARDHNQQRRREVGPTLLMSSIVARHYPSFVGANYYRYLKQTLRHTSIYFKTGRDGLNPIKEQVQTNWNEKCRRLLIPYVESVSNSTQISPSVQRYLNIECKHLSLSSITARNYLTLATRENPMLLSTELNTVFYTQNIDRVRGSHQQINSVVAPRSSSRHDQDEIVIFPISIFKPERRSSSETIGFEWKLLRRSRSSEVKSTVTSLVLIHNHQFLTRTLRKVIQQSIRLSGQQNNKKRDEAYSRENSYFYKAPNTFHASAPSYRAQISRTGHWDPYVPNRPIESQRQSGAGHERLISPAQLNYLTEKKSPPSPVANIVKPPALPINPPKIDIDRLSRDVWNQIEKRIRIERERHGRL